MIESKARQYASTSSSKNWRRRLQRQKCKYTPSAKPQRESNRDIEDVNLIFFFFLLFPSNLFTFLSSAYFSNLKFCVFLSLVLLNLSSSIFLNSQANYNRSEGKTLFHSFILYSLSHFGSFYSRLTRSSLKNISGQPEIALHEEIFWGGNWKTRVRFRKLCGLTAVREVHSKNIILGFFD